MWHSIREAILPLSILSCKSTEAGVRLRDVVPFSVDHFALGFNFPVGDFGIFLQATRTLLVLVVLVTRSNSTTCGLFTLSLFPSVASVADFCKPSVFVVNLLLLLLDAGLRFLKVFLDGALLGLL